jgi:predicted FMN-binding regulatory protein PaiB
MAEARQEDAWNHTSNVLAMLVNVNRDPKSTPADPRDFNPTQRGKEIKHEIEVASLKGIFKL